MQLLKVLGFTAALLISCGPQGIELSGPAKKPGALCDSHPEGRGCSCDGDNIGDSP